MTTHPTPSQLLAALLDHGVDVKTYNRWDTRGGRWGAYGGGLDGVVLHNTATPSATGSSGAPTLYWCAHTYDWAISNMLVGRGPGDTYLLSAAPSYHSGLGGPFPEIGINQAANVGHHQLFGIEVDDPGRTTSMTDYQIENTSRIVAALWDLCEWPDSGSRVITHQAWTDGSYGVNPNGPSPYLGRKGDTLHERWAEYPGSDKAERYNPIFWREHAAKYRTSVETWDGTVPTLRACQAAQRGAKNWGAWRLACRLYDLGFKDNPPKPKGEQQYPRGAVKRLQASWGWENPHGNVSPITQRRLFGKLKP